MYSQQVLEHFHHPRHRGDLASPDAIGESRYPPCGDRLRLTFRIADDRLVAVGFSAVGCGAAKAAGSVTTELLTGMALEDARNLSAFTLDKALGGLPISKRHAILMVLECLHQALGPRNQQHVKEHEQ